MCGIIGILSFSRNQISRNVLINMSKSLVHRGPDAEGIWIENNIGLGHRRLSIIDLSEAANQPMVSQNGRFIITYNGEIYNFKELKRYLISKGIWFKTNSDTEVLLELFALKGLDALTELRGMFAFAIWDKADHSLFLCRDRLGIKPLYYAINNSKLTFASEIKAILFGDPSLRTINSNALWKFLRLMTVPKPETIIDGIYKLEPGTCLQVNQNGCRKIHTYWELKDHIEQKESYNEEEEIDRIRQKLLESIQHHMIADVDIGAFLSGGLDSSSVVALMQDFSKRKKISTYSINFPGQKEIDEGEYSDIIANYLQTIHSIVYFKENFMDEMDKILWHCDEPFGITSSFGVYQLSKQASKDLKVVLTGDGGDEVFAGYSGYLFNSIDNGNLLLRLITGQVGSLIVFLKRLFNIIAVQNNLKIKYCL